MSEQAVRVLSIYLLLLSAACYFIDKPKLSAVAAALAVVLYTRMPRYD